jgi:hypothetical protein
LSPRFAGTINADVNGICTCTGANCVEAVAQRQIGSFPCFSQLAIGVRNLDGAP